MLRLCVVILLFCTLARGASLLNSQNFPLTSPAGWSSQYVSTSPAQNGTRSARIAFRFVVPTNEIWNVTLFRLYARSDAGDLYYEFFSSSGSVPVASIGSGIVSGGLPSSSSTLTPRNFTIPVRTFTAGTYFLSPWASSDLGPRFGVNTQATGTVVGFCGLDLRPCTIAPYLSPVMQYVEPSKIVLFSSNSIVGCMGTSLYSCRQAVLLVEILPLPLLVAFPPQQQAW